MKKIIIAFVFLFQIGTALPTHAASAVAGALEPTQWLNNIELVATNLTSGEIALSTGLDMVKNTILDPIANQLISAALEQGSNDIIAWANGGFEGEPLIIGDPEAYIKNKGLNQVRLALGAIPQNSVFGDSIFASLVNQYKDTSLTDQIKLVSQSNIPSLVQNNICSDQTLTSLALDDIRNSDGTYSDADLTAKKQELYTYAECGSGDPSDPALANKLADLNQQNPSIGGWDTWLATTGGDNDYTRGETVKTAVALNVAKEEEKRKNEIYLGAGAISQTRCEEYAPTSEDGEQPICIKEITLTPGDTVGATLDKAFTSGLDRLANITGEGSLSSLLEGFVTKYIVSGISQGLSSTSGGGSSGATNISTTIQSTRTPVAYKPGDAKAKADLVDTISKQTDYYNSSLSALEAIDRSYLADMATYEARVQSGRACYQSLESNQNGTTTDQQPTNDPQIVAGYAFYDGRQARINAVKNTIIPELNKVAEAKTIVASTMSQINASNSAEEIRTIFNTYMDKINSGGFPTTQTQGTRKAEYNKIKSEVSRDQEIITYENTCNQIRASRNNYGGGGSF